MPKSRIFTTSRWPSRSTSMMFSGLRSRWTTPAAVRVVERAQDLPLDGERALDAAAAPRRSPPTARSPARNSIARKSDPSAVRPKSVTVMMLGWARRLADSASRSKRRANSSLPDELGQQHLDGQIAPHHRVLGAVDRPHAAHADAAHDAVALADDGADERIGDGRAAAGAEGVLQLHLGGAAEQLDTSGAPCRRDVRRRSRLPGRFTGGSAGGVSGGRRRSSRAADR